MGLPSGISKRGKKFQARLCYVPTGGTKKELRGVGTFVTVEEAVAALAEAQRKLAKGGAAAVWQTEKETQSCFSWRLVSQRRDLLYGQSQNTSGVSTA